MLKRTLLIGAAAAFCLVHTLIPAIASADTIVFGGGKDRPVRFQVFRTFLFGLLDAGQPIVDEDLSAGMQKPYTIPTGFSTDYRTKQRFLSSSGAPTEATNSVGAVNDDGLAFSMPPLEQHLVATVGLNTVVGLPDLASETQNLFAFTDLNQWISSGVIPPPVGTTISFTNGVSPTLPGVTVGLSELSFDVNQGVVNSNPFTGQVFQIGVLAVAAVPEPSSWLLLASGLAGMMLWKKRNP